MQTAPRNSHAPLHARLRARVLRTIALGAVSAVMLIATLPGAAMAAGRNMVSPPFEARASALPLITGAGYFGGLTSKGWPVTVRVSRNGSRVRHAVAGVELRCTSGGSFAIPDEWRDLPIRRRRFGESFTGTLPGGPVTVQVTSTIAGRLNRPRTRIAGTWRSATVERNAAGATVDTCDTGPLRFTVRR